jgi:hypothetical protein
LHFPYFEKIEQAYEITLASVYSLSLLGNGLVKIPISLLGNSSVKISLSLLGNDSVNVLLSLLGKGSEETLPR